MRYVPFRGDGPPKEPKSRKKFVNLKKLRQSLTKHTLFITTLGIAITIIAFKVTDPASKEKNIHIVALVILWVMLAIFIIGIFDLNKFRKGYDVDTSERDKDEEMKDDDNYDENSEK